MCRDYAGKQEEVVSAFYCDPRYNTCACCSPQTSSGGRSDSFSQPTFGSNTNNNANNNAGNSDSGSFGNSGSFGSDPFSSGSSSPSGSFGSPSSLNSLL